MRLTIGNAKITSPGATMAATVAAVRGARPDGRDVPGPLSAPATPSVLSRGSVTACSLPSFLGHWAAKCGKLPDLAIQRPSGQDHEVVAVNDLVRGAVRQVTCLFAGS